LTIKIANSDIEDVHFFKVEVISATSVGYRERLTGGYDFLHGVGFADSVL